MRRRALGLTALVSMSLVAATALAQTSPSLDLRGFHAPVDPSSGIYLEPADSPKTGEWNAGLWTNYSFRPLVLTDPTTHATSRVVSQQVSADVVGAVGLFHRILVGVDVPFVIYQTGDTPTAAVDAATGNATLPHEAFGDVGVDLKTTLLRPTSGELGGFAVALTERFTLPAGNQESYIGEGSTTSETRVLGELRYVAIGVHAALGVKLRGEGAFGCADVPTLAGCVARFGDEIPFGLGLTFKPQAIGLDDKGRFTFFFETHGYVPLAPSHPFSNQAVSEAQLDLGARVAFGPVSILAGIEKGLIQGVGNPDVRSVLSVGFAPRVHDKDGDGIPDDVDQCPSLPEDFDGFQDADGCPDGDNDDDGIPDAEDACPNQAGPPNPDPKKNGCPVAKAPATAAKPGGAPAP